MLTLYSPDDLKNYCLRALGSPVINIEVDDTQLDDRVDEALQFFIEQHYDGSTERHIRYTITSDDVSRGYLTLPDNVPIVIDIIDPNLGSGNGEEFENLNFLLANSDIANMVTGTEAPNLVPYYVSMEAVATLRRFFSPKRMFEYNAINRELKVYATLEAGRTIFIHCYESLDPDNDINVYNDRWLKKYTVELIKKQWGMNTKKYKGVQLAGGITSDGKEIYDEAVEELNKLEEEFISRYTLPPQFFMG